MNWQTTAWLWVAASLALLVPAGAWFGTYRRRQQERIASPGVWRRWMGDPPATGSARLVLLASAAVLAALGAAGPRAVGGAGGPGVAMTWVVAADVSFSMLATDVHPNRLRAGLETVRGALAGSAPGFWGMVAGGSGALPVVPLTADRATVMAALERRAWPPELQRGSDLGALLAAAGSLLGPAAAAAGVIVVSDGEAWDAEATGVAGSLRRAGVQIVAVRSGTTTGAPIPEEDSHGEPADAAQGPRYRRHPDGSLALTRARPELLAELAGGGHLVVDTSDSSAVRRLGQIMADGRAARGTAQGEDRSPWFFLPAALLASGAFFLWPWRRVAGVAALAVIGLTSACHPPEQTPAAPVDWQRLRRDLAQRVQADPGDRGARLSWATAAAACGDQEGEAVLRTLAGDREMAAVAWFNLGTVLLLQERWDDAVAPLQAAVVAAPGNPAAWRNLELASRRSVARLDPAKPELELAEQLVRSVARETTAAASPVLPPPSPATAGGPPW